MSTAFAYSIVTPIQVKDVLKLEKGGTHDWKIKINGSASAKVPKNTDFTVTVTIPRIKPDNLVPLDPAKQVEAGLLVHASVFKTDALSKVRFDNLAKVGEPDPPGGHPQRKSHLAGKRNPKDDVQTFKFKAGSFPASSKVVFVFQSIHIFFDDKSGGVPFAKRRPIIMEITKDVEA